ncbi:fumarylacetoacetate hydrolase family protein [Halalkalibacterium ligniniphilum]|uniref:fumarylacetoacetate hydrolase family protein n=1 Tax=Halalkalibacterium ligniniphilum TaxID=1134413 RepID=UPI0003479936|nr:fumarylacetoacetate hydrolase family protein [Halalkalibacterium ligniniphilum]
MNEIKNIYCIGRNYAKHAVELGNAIPEKPILFSKPTRALTVAKGQTVLFPSNRGEIHHELEIVLHVSKDVKQGDHVEDVIDKMALGIDFTLRDEQSELKKQGHPWLRAKGFKSSAIVTDFWAFPGIEACRNTNFSLTKNGDIVQQGNIQDMMFNFQQIIEQISEAFGLGTGDIIYTGTPEGVGAIQSNDEFRFYWGEEEKGSFIVSM